MTRGPRAACVLALLALAAAAGCLPRGDAPAGRQVLADRTATLVGLLPANGDGTLRALFLRPGKTSDLADLHVLSVDANGGPPSERLLAMNVSSVFELDCPRSGGHCHGVDARGRLYLSQLSDTTPVQQRILRIDPVTGETLDLGSGFSWIESESGQRVLVPDDSGGYLLYDADDSTIVIPGLASDPGQLQLSPVPTLVGDVVFYQTADGDLMRIPVGGGPERVATGVSNVFHLGPLLVLERASSDPSMPAQSAFDPATVEETPLPAGFDFAIYGVSVSQDGRWLCAGPFSVSGGPGPFGPPGQDAPDVVLFDRLTGTVETLDPRFRLATFRPGHAELWTSSYDPTMDSNLSASTLLIKRPGEPIVMMSGVLLQGEVGDEDPGGLFTPDGAYWFSRGLPLTEQQASDRVGAADDPAGPVFDLVPAGRTARSYWPLRDGRLLVEIYTDMQNVFENFDVQAVDPRTGAARPLGERGIVTTVGDTRVLAIFHVIYERGDLTTVDLASGQSTVLAHEFAMAAFAEPRGADPYPPGGRVLYQFRARFDSPFDGLWLATAP
jgi:hypothetical protein